MGPPPALRGYPFPLVLRPPHEEDRRCLPRYQAQRRARGDVVEDLLSEAIVSLNAMESSRAGTRLPLAAATRAATSSEVGPSRDAVLNRLGRAAARHLPRPRKHLLCPDGALCELLKTKDVYDVMHPTTQLPYDRTKLRVVRGGLAPKPAADLVDPSAAEFLRDPGRHIIKPDAELDTSPITRLPSRSGTRVSRTSQVSSTSSWRTWPPSG